jgi:glutathione S-transferase
MKLYYGAGSCSLSPHIVLKESGLAFEAVAVNLRTHQLTDGSDYYRISPKGYVPLLVLDNGQTLSEGAAIVQYIADQAPEKALAPASGTWERYKLQEWLNFISTELHKGFSPLFNPQMPEEAKALARTKLLDRFKWVDEQLSAQAYLMGPAFCVADAYLFTVSGWGKFVGVDLSGFSHLGQFLERMRERPAVQAALKAEGLLK